MKYPELLQALVFLAEKYQEYPFSSWKVLYREDESYTDDNFEVESDQAKWQARTEVLDMGVDVKGVYANVSIVVYPEGVHSFPPVPGLGMWVYKSGRVEVSLPDGSYTFVQK